MAKNETKKNNKVNSKKKSVKKGKETKLADETTKSTKDKKTGGALKEIKDLAKILSGEMDLMEKEEALEKKKDAAKKRSRTELANKVSKGDMKIEKDDTAVDAEDIVQNIKLFSWDAPIRLRYAFEMKAFMTIVAVSLLFIIYLAVLGHYMLMLSIVAILFLLYVAGTTEPLIITNIITARGIDTLDKLYEWFVLDKFWFTVKNDQQMLIIDTKLKFPSRLILMLDIKDRPAIFMLLQEKLLYRDVRKVKKMEGMSFGEYVKLEDV